MKVSNSIFFIKGNLTNFAETLEGDAENPCY